RSHSLIRRARAKETSGKPSDPPLTLLVNATPNSDSEDKFTLTRDCGQRLPEPMRTNPSSKSSKIHVFELTRFSKKVAASFPSPNNLSVTVAVWRSIGGLSELAS